jgi:H+/Cl- antiporter ClcA
VNSTDAHVRAARLRVLSEAVTKLLVAVALAAVTIALAIVLVRQNHVVSSTGANYCTTRHPHITMPDLIDCVLTVVKQLEKIRLPVPMDTQATPTRVPVSPHPSRSP